MLTKFRSLVYKHAVPSAVILALVFYALMQGVSLLFSLMPRNIAVRYLDEIVGMLYPVGIVVLLGFSDSFKSKHFLKCLFCGLPWILFQIFGLQARFVVALDQDIVWMPWHMVILGLVTMISIGVREECIFRVSVQNILAKKYGNSVKSVWAIAIVSALIFGLIHAFNFFTGVDPKAAIIQAVTNVGSGLFFAALYLRYSNFWALALIHALTDTNALFDFIFLQKSTTDVINSASWSSLILGAAYIGVSIFLLRPSKCRMIAQRLHPETDKDRTVASRTVE